MWLAQVSQRPKTRILGVFSLTRQQFVPNSHYPVFFFFLVPGDEDRPVCGDGYLRSARGPDPPTKYVLLARVDAHPQQTPKIGWKCREKCT